MAPEYVALISFAAIILLIAAGIPIAFSMTVVSVLGLFYVTGLKGTFEFFVNYGFRSATAFEFTALPLFLLTGHLAYHSGLVSSAFDAASLWLSRLPGGLGMATSLASGMMGACMGSGASATATMSRIAIPEMLRHNYDKSFATGTVAAAATVAVLIPPSAIMVIYATFTGVSLGRMLLAGYLPGILSIVIYIGMIGVRAKLNPKLAPSIHGEIITWKLRIQAVKNIWGIMVLFVVILGGMYSGLFTATETAALATFIALILMFITRNFSWSAVRNSCAETMEITAMVFLLMISAGLFTLFITVSGLPKMLTTWIIDANLSPSLLIYLVLVLYFFLGCFMEAVSMMLLTLPILLPILLDLNVNLIWFGILFIKTVEVGAITPPYGMGVYIVKAVVGDTVPIDVIFRGIGWFVIMDILTIAILIAFPQISLWLPNTMKGG